MAPVSKVSNLHWSWSGSGHGVCCDGVHLGVGVFVGFGGRRVVVWYDFVFQLLVSHSVTLMHHLDPKMFGSRYQMFKIGNQVNF